MELKSLNDFQRLETSQLSALEIKTLVGLKPFFLSPKSNNLICGEHSAIVDKILGFRIKYVVRLQSWNERVTAHNSARPGGPTYDRNQLQLKKDSLHLMTEGKVGDSLVLILLQ